jgi:hypothetical protein
VAPIQELFFLPKFYQRKNYRLALETAKPAAFKTSPIGPNNPSTASDGKFCKLTAIALKVSPFIWITVVALTELHPPTIDLLGYND